MKIVHDKEADSLYIYFSKNRIKKTVRVSDRVFVDLDAKGTIKGIEMLFVGKTIFPDTIKEIAFSTATSGEIILKLPVMTIEQLMSAKTKIHKTN